MIRLDKLSYEGEECIERNPEKPISEAQKKALYLIKNYFKKEFKGKTFGEAWDFIHSFSGMEYIDSNGKKEIFHIKRDDQLPIDEPTYDNEIDEKEYFNKRHKAMLKGEDWSHHDVIEPDHCYGKEEKDIPYDINYDDGELDDEELD